jgi:hypothetical protein
MALWSPSAGRYLTVLRVFTRRIPLSESAADVARSVKAPILLWLWLTRTLDTSVRNVVAGIFRAAAGIIAAGADPAELSAGCCALKFCDLTSEDARWRSTARYGLCLTPPSLYPIIPVYNAEKAFAVCGNSVFADEEGNEEARAAYEAAFVGARLRRPVPDWCKTPDPKSLQFLSSLVSG